MSTRVDPSDEIEWNDLTLVLLYRDVVERKVGRKMVKKMNAKSENSEQKRIKEIEPKSVEKVKANPVEKVKANPVEKAEEKPIEMNNEEPNNTSEEKMEVKNNAVRSGCSQKKKSTSKRHAIKEKIKSLMEWQVGDYCRAAYTEDGILYEAKIVEVDDDSCIVEFLGYGNKQRVYFNCLAASMGKQARKEQRKVAAECINWNVGDFCRAVYPEDGLLYEAVVEEVDGEKCVVRFIGYENTEVVQLYDIFQSEGPEAREVQKRNGSEMWMLYRDAQHAENGEDVSSISSTYSLLSDMNSNQCESRISGTKAKMPTCSHPCSDHDEHASHSSARRRRTSLNLNNVPFPPVPFPFQNCVPSESSAFSSLVMSWYLAGYHSGFFEGVRSKRSEHCNCTEHMPTCCMSSR